jgi:hypothetical protein
MLGGKLVATLLEARSFISLLLFQAYHSVVFLQFFQYPLVNRGAPAGFTAKYWVHVIGSQSKWRHVLQGSRSRTDYNVVSQT